LSLLEVGEDVRVKHSLRVDVEEAELDFVEGGVLDEVLELVGVPEGVWKGSMYKLQFELGVRVSDVLVPVGDPVEVNEEDGV
jgi:hypothetical protein